MRRGWRTLVPVLAWGVVMGAAVGPAMSEGIDFAGNGDGPIEVYADKGIEWEQTAKVFTARGNARAVRGKVAVTADSLTAHYRDKDAGSSTDIWKLEAKGSVTIASPTETATGDTAVYTMDDARLVLHGRPARLVTPKQTITARDGIEYFEAKRFAVARGKVEVHSEGRTLRADEVTASFTPVGGKETKVSLVNAKGNVLIETDKEVVRGDVGVYNVETGIATLDGSVKITREDNQLNGSHAVVNLKTGVSQIFAAQPGTGTRERVKLLLAPGKK
ncbi:MAG: hypothetical protein HQL34_10445 [Alphaproteobacteria bacterium]|nr:hypothetical protein [Alphaproteobacteria bacterium]